MDWFALINIQNLLLIFIGFCIGYFWRVGKKFIEYLNNENKTKTGEGTNTTV